MSNLPPGISTSSKLDRVSVVDAGTGRREVIRLMDIPGLVIDYPTLSDIPNQEGLYRVGSTLYINSGMGPIPLDSASANAASITSDQLTLFRQQILLNPLLAPKIGARFLVTDGLLAGRVTEWNGSAFNNLSRSMVIASRYDTGGIAIRNSNNTNDTVYQIMESLIIPGFLMGENSSLIPLPLWDVSATGTAIQKNLGASLWSPGTNEVPLPAFPLTNNLGSESVVKWHNCNSLAQQRFLNNVGYSSAGSSSVESTVNTTYDFEFRFRCNWASNNAGAQIKLMGYLLTLEG